MLRDVLRAEILPMLEEFSGRLAQSSDASIRTGSTFNEAFTLRAYVRGERSNGNEVAITIDARAAGGRLRIDSEICGEDGHLFKTGPSFEVALVDDQEALNELHQWSHRFRKYLEENERYMVELLDK